MSAAEQVRHAVGEVLAEHTVEESHAALRGRLFDAGIAWVDAPPGQGGRGLHAELQTIVDEALDKAGVPPAHRLNPIGLPMAAPTIRAHGTPEQVRRWLRPLYVGEQIWCQLFSEPGAGSDLAGLATQAVRVGDFDGWRISGQKVWTSDAHRADRGLLVARTDPAATKHRGLTYFGIDMHAPGITVRPLRQMTGGTEFNEVYFDDVPVPDEDRIGAVGAGWSVAMTTLTAERGGLGASLSPRRGGPLDAVLEAWQALPADVRDAATRDRVAGFYVQAEAFQALIGRMQRLVAAGAPGPDGGVAKIAMAELNQTGFELAMDLMGLAALTYPGYDDPDLALTTVQQKFLRVRANSIEGGTSEIVRNTLGERVLGLPREPSVDRDRPWRDIPRG